MPTQYQYGRWLGCCGKALPADASAELRQGYADGLAHLERLIDAEVGAPVNDLRKRMEADMCSLYAGDSTIDELRKMVANDCAPKLVRKPLVIVTAVRLPGGAVETAENRECIEDKLSYILGAYDDNMCLKNKPEVQMIGYMLVVQP